MKEISLTKLKAMKLSEILAGKCIKVTGHGWKGEQPLYIIPRPEGEMRARIEGICSQINAGRGA
jgi:hypothetical protein